MLDERLRSRLRQVDTEASGVDLDTDARDRVVRTVGERGPELVRRSRTRRAVTLAGGLAAAAGIALAVGWRSPVSVSSSESVADVPSRSEGASDESMDESERALAARAPNRACEAWTAPEEARFSKLGEARALDLGAVAFVSAGAGADVRVVEATACRTIVELESGRVAVHAKDLGGGDFVVRAAETEVRVTGTIFSVARADGAVTVDVVEGTVLVDGRTLGTHSVEAGRRLEAVADAVVESELDDVDHERLIRDVSPAVARTDDAQAPVRALIVREDSRRTEDAPETPVAEADVEGAEQLLSRADALRQANDLDGARRLYRRVGAGTGPNAEAAWLALARMELQAGNPKEAAQATAQRKARFGTGALGPESLWIAVRSHRQAGNDAKARAVARQLVRNWPDSPQADAARRFLAE